MKNSLKSVSIKVNIMGIRKEGPMCFTLIEHFIREMSDILLNSFDDTQTGILFCRKVFEVVSILASVKNDSCGTLNTNGDFVSLHIVASITSFPLLFQNHMSAA